MDLHCDRSPAVTVRISGLEASGNTNRTLRASQHTDEYNSSIQMRDTPSGIFKPGTRSSFREGDVTQEAQTCAGVRPGPMEKLWDEELPTEPLRGGLKELVMRWFTETQTALVQVNGSFPDWFQGFASRQETEDLLRDKALGCFLIRLSDKAMGYILSYRGHDRCRHFVITQNQDGQFTITGDSRSYQSLSELVQHYRTSPIQPFGEYLTSSSHEENTGELYDVVSFNNKGKSGVSVQALRTLWDQKTDQHREPASKRSVPQQHDAAPSLPPKTQGPGRKLMGTVSVDAASLPQSAPPVAKRGFPPGFSQSGSLPETTTHPSETKMESQRSTEGTHHPPLMSEEPQSNSELEEEGRSKSLPHLDSNVGEEQFSHQSSSLSKSVTCHTYSLHEPPAQGPGSRSEQHSPDLDMLKANPLYQASEKPVQTSGPQAGSMYAEVTQRSTPAHQSDDTYEPIPGEATGPAQANTYESLAEIKKSKSTWGKSNIKWKKFLPDYMKK